jgi:hypothetical protein
MVHEKYLSLLTLSIFFHFYFTILGKKVKKGGTVRRTILVLLGEPVRIDSPSHRSLFRLMPQGQELGKHPWV